MSYRVFIILFSILTLSGCLDESEDESCVFYNIEGSSLSRHYTVNNNNSSNQIDYCEYTLFQNGSLVREKREIRDGLCQRVLDAAKGIDYENVYTTKRGHSMRLWDGEKFIIKGTVDPDKIQPILDILYAECPSSEDKNK